MTKKLQQIMKEEIMKLPREKQQVINDFDWAGLTQQIGHKFSLNESEVNDFQVETGLVLIGLADPDLYTKNIEKNVGTSKEEAEKMTDEVMEKIFTPMINKMEALVKNTLGLKTQTWKQSINFIVSGGDYSAFIEK